MKRSEGRLSAEDWLNAGFRALVARGPRALSAEGLARDLGITKGSFYWHFSTLPEFETRMLEYWRSRAFLDILDEVGSIEGPRQRLDALLVLAGAHPHDDVGGIGAEPAIRAWAKENARAKAIVREVDAGRIDALNELFAALGEDDPIVARLVYSAYIGLTELSVMDGGSYGEPLRRLAEQLLQKR